MLLGCLCICPLQWRACDYDYCSMCASIIESVCACACAWICCSVGPTLTTRQDGHWRSTQILQHGRSPVARVHKVRKIKYANVCVGACVCMCVLEGRLGVDMRERKAERGGGGIGGKGMCVAFKPHSAGAAGVCGSANYLPLQKKVPIQPRRGESRNQPSNGGMQNGVHGRQPRSVLALACEDIEWRGHNDRTDGC